MADPRGTGPQGEGETLSSLRTFWDDRARREATDCERVDMSRRTQRMRFERFLLAHDLRGRSILDVGCGVGDLWEHLCARGIACDYHGVDLSGEMAARAKARFPEATFETANVLDWDDAPRFDYVIAIGVHNVKVEGARELLERLTRKQFALARVAAHLSLLTDRYDKFGPQAMPWRAEEVLGLGLSITPYVTLRHDYLPNDFAVTLYREALIDTRKDLDLG